MEEQELELSDGLGVLQDYLDSSALLWAWLRTARYQAIQLNLFSDYLRGCVEAVEAIVDEQEEEVGL